MALEIERKFLLKHHDFKKSVVAKHYICQGYIAGADLATVRVRIADGDAFLTLKSQTESFTRSEFEYAIPLVDAEEMLKSFCGIQIKKYRYIVWVEGKCWEIDEFLGENKGLWVAEIELSSEQEEFVLPTWAGEEVTHDTRYRNTALINNPYKNWKE